MEGRKSMREQTVNAMRRAMIAGAAAGALAGSTTTMAQAPFRPKTFVLVHGASQGGWCWRRVSDRLGRRGHKGFTPPPTGLGERSHLMCPDVDLDIHITAVGTVIKWGSLGKIGGIGLAGSETTRAADRGLAQADQAHRRARPRREEDLYPGDEVRESELRPLLREDESRSVLAHLRGGVRPRRDDRHARPADGDTSGGGASFQTFVGVNAFLLICANIAKSNT